MFKFAIAAGIVFEWLFGAGVFSLQSLGYAALRTLCATLLAWMALEGVRVLFLAAMSLPDRPATAATRRSGTPR
jgi:hypothetical protein